MDKATKEDQGGTKVFLTSPDGMFWVLVHKGSADYKPLTKAGFVDLGPDKREEQIEAMMPDDPFEYLDKLKPIPGISEAMKEEIQEKYRFAREFTLFLLAVNKNAANINPDDLKSTRTH